jgi:hypothetical protein
MGFQQVRVWMTKKYPMGIPWSLLWIPNMYPSLSKPQGETHRFLLPVTIPIEHICSISTVVGCSTLPSPHHCRNWACLAQFWWRLITATHYRRNLVHMLNFDCNWLFSLVSDCECLFLITSIPSPLKWAYLLVYFIWLIFHFQIKYFLLIFNII